MVQMRRRTRLSLLALALSLGLMGCGAVTETTSAAALDNVGASQESSESAEEANAAYPDFSQSSVEWQGKHYRRNTYVKPILLLGIDNAGSMQEEKEYGYAGQCDAIFLLAQDTARNTVKLLLIPRDTMTEVLEENPNTGVIEPYTDHLSLSYCFGDGREESCENTRYSVQKLLMNLEINDYMAIDTTVISTLNDAVDGVTVTIPTEGMESADPAFVYGETVTLHGAQAEKFVRYRDTSVDNSALNRTLQHRQYITGFFQASKNKSMSESSIITKLYDQMQDYMITNMQKESYLKAALDVLRQSTIDDSNMLTLPGYGTATDTYDEYYAETDSIPDILLDMFYREAQ